MYKLVLGMWFVTFPGFFALATDAKPPIAFPDLTPLLELTVPNLNAADQETWLKLKEKLAKNEEAIRDYLKIAYQNIDKEAKKTAEGLLTTFNEAGEKLTKEPEAAEEKKQKWLKQREDSLTEMQKIMGAAQAKKADFYKDAQKKILDATEAKLHQQLSDDGMRLIYHLSQNQLLKWNDAFSTFEDDAREKQLKLLSLEHLFDGKIMGKYAQAKLQNLLSSDAFCKASQCKGNTNSPPAPGPRSSDESKKK